MPAKSKAQQRAAGAALAAKRGETPKGRLKGASKAMAQSMTEKELRDLARTRIKSLPSRANQESAAGQSAPVGEAALKTARTNRHLLPSRKIPRG
jgi:hypothetical protein